MRKSLLRLLPWLVTAGLLFLLFRRISFAEVVAGTHRARRLDGAGHAACVAAVYLADSFAIWKTFGWFLTRMSLPDVLLVRGATYLLAAINYNVGQGAIVYFVHRTAGTTIMRGVATILLVLGTNVLALLFLATAGLAVAPAVPQRSRSWWRSRGPGSRSTSRWSRFARAGSTARSSRCCSTPASAATRARSPSASRTSRR